MANEQQTDKIEAWIKGKLPSAEAAAFQAEMDSDLALAEEVELHRLALQAGAHLSEQYLKDNVLKWVVNEDTFSPSPQSNSNNWKWATTTLLLLLLAVTFWHFWRVANMQAARNEENAAIAQRDSVIAVMRIELQQIQDSLSTLISLPIDSFYRLEIKRLREEVDRKDKVLRTLEAQGRTGKPQLAMQFAPSPNALKRGQNTGDDPTLVNAKNAYETGDFATSATLLKSIQPNNPRYPQVRQLLPYSLFYAKDFEAAVPGFVFLLEEDTFGDPELPWYLALCYVGTGQQMEARILLHNIMQNPKHKYYQKAIDLKKALNVR